MSRYNPTSDPIVQQLAGLSKTSFNRQFIFRVHQRLRSQNEEAYEPEMISIGPYHHGKDKLQKMEKYKLQYLQGILERQGTEFIPEFRAAVIYEEAQNCYAEDISLSPEEFVDMMIFDGCFIIEFLRKYNVFKGKVEDPHIYGKAKDDPIFSMQWQVESLCRDLLLFENQLPFFILERLFNLTNFQGDKRDLSFYAISCLNHCIAAESSYKIKPPENRVFHLLRLMYESWCSPRDTKSQTPISRKPECWIRPCAASVLEPTIMRPESQTPISRFSLEDNDLLMAAEVVEPRIMDPESWDLEQLKSVCELEEHGIEFEKAVESKSWLAIKFENSVMKIPPLVVQDHTESLLRNLIAYEEYMFELGYSGKAVTDYAIFMVCLLKSSEDAKKLRHHKIIKNMLGKDEAVSEMFNKICNNIFYYPASYSYSDIFKKVDPIVQQLAGLSKKSFNKQFIFRVHQRLRSQNEEAYEPEMLSIGPYHRGKDKLQKMEKYKLQYLQGIFERKKKGSHEEFISEFRKAFMKYEEEARNYYAEDISLSPEEFVDMMILDGCFIIEFLRKYYVFKGKVEDPHIYGQAKDDPIFSMQWQVESLCRDLLLFENQLPFFILKRLFNLTNIQGDQRDLGFYAISCFNHCIAADNPAESSYNMKPPENRVFHLLSSCMKAGVPRGIKSHKLQYSDV